MRCISPGRSPQPMPWAALSPAGDPAELEAHPQPAPVGGHPLQKAPEQLTPDIL